MLTHFITLEIDRPPETTQLQQAIEAELRQWGEPLRWAIVGVDRQRGKVQIEAVVTRSSEFWVAPELVRTV